MIRAREPCFGIVCDLGTQLTVLYSGLTVSLPVGFTFLKKQLLDDISGEKAAERICIRGTCTACTCHVRATRGTCAVRVCQPGRAAGSACLRGTSTTP